MANTTLLSFEAFKEAFPKDVKEHLDGKGDSIYEVAVKPVEKMNVKYDGLSVRKDNDSFGASINMNHCYDLYKNGKTYEDVVESTTKMAFDAIENRPDFDLNSLCDYGQVKEKLSIEVVSAERNADLLMTVPYEKIEDMAVVYRIVLDDVFDEGTASVLVTNHLLERYGITKETLRKDALEIAPVLRPAVIRGMGETLAEMMADDGVDFMTVPDEADEIIFVASVPNKMHGSGILAYQNFMDEAAKRLGGDFYILPSSIHELLLVKDNGNFTVEALSSMVHEVNATQVLPEDLLTDSVYHYDSEDKIFEMGEKFISRKSKQEVSA